MKTLYVKPLMLLVIFCALRVNADYRLPLPGAAASARGGGNYSLVDDANAVHINPARMVFLEERIRGELSLTPQFYRVEVTSQSSPGDRETTVDPLKYSASFNAVFPFDEQRWAFGVGINTPYGLSSTVEPNGVFIYNSPHTSEIYFIDIAPTIAFRVTERFSIGLGIDFAYNKLNLDQTYPWFLVTGNPLSKDGDMEFEADGQAFGATLGLYWNPIERHHFGLRMRAPMDFSLDGEFRINNVPGVGNARSKFTTELNYAGEIDFGYSFEVNEQLRVGFDAAWIDYSRVETLTLDIGNLNALLLENSIPLNWESSWIVGVGADWEFTPHWFFRAGYQYIESPMPDEYYIVAIASADRHLVTAGIGYRGDRHALEASLGYSIYPDRDISTNRNPIFNRTYEFDIQYLQVSYRLAF